MGTQPSRVILPGGLGFGHRASNSSMLATGLRAEHDLRVAARQDQEHLGGQSGGVDTADLHVFFLALDVERSAAPATMPALPASLVTSGTGLTRTGESSLRRDE